MRIVKYDTRRASEKIRKWQKEAKLKGQDVAKKAGISGAYFSDIRRGNQRGSIDVLASIAEVLNHSVEELLFDNTLDGMGNFTLPDSPISDEEIWHLTLRWARIAKGMDREDLDLELGVEKGQVARWEKKIDPPPDDYLLRSKIRDILGVNFNTLLTGDVFEGNDSFPIELRWMKIGLSELLEKTEKAPALPEGEPGENDGPTEEEVEVHRKIQSNPKLFEIWQSLIELPDELSDEDVDRLASVIRALFPPKRAPTPNGE